MWGHYIVPPPGSSLRPPGFYPGSRRGGGRLKLQSLDSPTYRGKVKSRAPKSETRGFRHKNVAAYPIRAARLEPASANQRGTCPIRALGGLLVEADHVSCRIAEPRRDLGRIGADRLHDLAPMHYNHVNGRGNAVNHDAKQEPGLCGGGARAPRCRSLGPSYRQRECCHRRVSG